MTPDKKITRVKYGIKQSETYVDKGDLDKIKKQLKRDYNPFFVGYIGYPPFTSAEGQRTAKEHERKLFDAFNEIGRNLGVKVIFEKVSWADFPTKMDEGRIQTMIEPVLPGEGRCFYIVPCYQMRVNVLLCKRPVFPAQRERLKDLVKEINEKYRKYIDEENDYNIKTIRSQIADKLREIGNIGDAQGFAVTKGTVEDATFKDLTAPPRKYLPEMKGESTMSDTDSTLGEQHSYAKFVNSLRGQENDIVVNSLLAVMNYQIIIDLPSAIRTQQIASGCGVRLDIHPIFECDDEMVLIAGTPISTNYPDLAIYMWHHVSHPSGQIRKALDWLDDNLVVKAQLKKYKMDIMNPQRNRIDILMTEPKPMLMSPKVKRVGNGTTSPQRVMRIDGRFRLVPKDVLVPEGAIPKDEEGEKMLWTSESDDWKSAVKEVNEKLVLLEKDFGQFGGPEIYCAHLEQALEKALHVIPYGEMKYLRRGIINLRNALHYQYAKDIKRPQLRVIGEVIHILSDADTHFEKQNLRVIQKMLVNNDLPYLPTTQKAIDEYGEGIE